MVFYLLIWLLCNFPHWHVSCTRTGESSLLLTAFILAPGHMYSPLTTCVLNEGTHEWVHEWIHLSVHRWHHGVHIFTKADGSLESSSPKLYRWAYCGSCLDHTKVCGTARTGTHSSVLFPFPQANASCTAAGHPEWTKGVLGRPMSSACPILPLLPSRPMSEGGDGRYGASKGEGKHRMRGEGHEERSCTLYFFPS